MGLKQQLKHKKCQSESVQTHELYVVMNYICRSLKQLQEISQEVI